MLSLNLTRLAAESIAINIAEGRGSAFDVEYIRFLDIAARSANELSSQLTMAMEYAIVPRRTTSC